MIVLAQGKVLIPSKFYGQLDIILDNVPIRCKTGVFFGYDTEAWFNVNKVRDIKNPSRYQSTVNAMFIGLLVTKEGDFFQVRYKNNKVSLRFIPIEIIESSHLVLGCYNSEIMVMSASLRLQQELGGNLQDALEGYCLTDKTKDSSFWCSFTIDKLKSMAQEYAL